MSKIKLISFIGLCLVILGIIAIVVEQISYTRREKLLEIGPLEAVVDKEAHCFRLPLVFGALVIVAGIAIIAVEKRKR